VAGWLAQIEDFRAALAQLFGGELAEYCPQANLSSGLSKLLLALPAASASQRTLLAAEDSFPSLGFVLQKAARLGFETRLIPRAQLPDELDTWSRELTPEVRIALVTHVHSNTGRVAPVAEIARLCRERGILCVVDVAQSAGILPLDFSSLGADVCARQLHQVAVWRAGAGYLWIRPGMIERLEPADVGWFSHQDPFEMDIHSFRYAEDARRFWGGTPSVAPFVIAAASLRHLHALGVAEIHAHNRRLVEMFKETLTDAWRSRMPAWRTGGTLCIPLGGEFDAVTRSLKQGRRAVRQPRRRGTAFLPCLQHRRRCGAPSRAPGREIADAGEHARRGLRPLDPRPFRRHQHGARGAVFRAAGSDACRGNRRCAEGAAARRRARAHRRPAAGRQYR
jgi:selenocysteine lyase/cysteine desulfurase